MPFIHAVTKDNYRTDLTNGNHRIVADEPESVGGTDKGLAPRELLHASLASCASITMRMYANRKEWPVEEIDVWVEPMLNTETETMYLRKKIAIKGDLDEKQLLRMKQISDKCPIQKLLKNSIEIQTEFA
jgi:putative redox protein